METGPYVDTMRELDRLAAIYGPERIAQWCEGWIATRAPSSYRPSGAPATAPVYHALEEDHR